MTITVYEKDIPANLDLGNAIAVDTETMGLNTERDRLCLVQLSSGDGNAHLVKIAAGQKDAPNLKKMLENTKTLKLFHFARFDLCALRFGLGIDCRPIYCTRTASRLARTYTDKHGLKDNCRELLGIDLNKQQQTSDWGADVLSDDQKAYAASDVLYLHQLKEKLDTMLAREGRTELAQACFDFLPARAQLDLAGWPEIDIFAHE
ncbi:MAG: ribonuclease D [Alphaproteobacteria bacterium]|nr:ribonuclease D [Alphaproteobacteria bacterium]